MSRGIVGGSVTTGPTPAPDPAPAIQSELHYLQDGLGYLEARVGELFERLSPILSPDGVPVAPETGDAPAVPGSMLAERLRSLRQQAYRIADSVNELMSRSEV